MAPCKLLALTSPAETEPALLIKRMGKVCYLQASRMQISGLKEERVMFR